MKFTMLGIGTRGAFHKNCHQWQMTVLGISYWNLCFWLVINRFVTDFCTFFIEKGLYETGPKDHWALERYLLSGSIPMGALILLWLLGTLLPQAHYLREAGRAWKAGGFFWVVTLVVEDSLCQTLLPLLLFFALPFGPLSRRKRCLNFISASWSRMYLGKRGSAHQTFALILSRS